jgi:hypothetical protein
MNAPGRRLDRWAFVSIGAIVVITLLDIIVPGEVLLGLLVGPPLVAASRSSFRTTISVSIASLFAALFLGIENHIWLTSDHIIRSSAVMISGVLASGIARARGQADEQWHTLFDRHPQPLWVFDRESLRFLAVNNAAVQRYGWPREEFLNLTIADIRPPDEMPKVFAGLASLGQGPQGVWRHQHKDGSIFSVETYSHGLDFQGHPAQLVVAQDVTQRLSLEAQFRQAQKMEAIGRLSAGIAHDFNNMLAVIMTYAGLLQHDVPPGDQRGEDLNHIIEAANRAHLLTRQLLTFSRQQVIQPVVLDTNAVVAGTADMLRRVLGEDIQLLTPLDPAVGNVRADRGQVEQVLMNLAVNARDAMEHGGTLTITTGNADLDDIGAQLHGLKEAGRYVTVSIADNGVGMSPEVRARVFEPFFTTKEPGKGTGLGLATVFGIVAQSGGHITLYSEIGRGTTFHIYLPRVIAAAAAAAAAEQPAQGGNETILLAEDNAAVRAVTAGVLERYGYKVLVASNAEDALALASRFADTLHLVLSDVVLPGMDGPTLVSRLAAVRPGTKALFMSGYAGEAVTRRGVLESGVPFLEKPFTVAGLTRKVREVLEAG